MVDGEGLLVYSSSRDLGLLLEPVIGVEAAAVVKEARVAVEGIAARLGRVVHLHARLAAVLGSVAIAHHRDFLNFVLADQQVARAGVVLVQKRVVYVVAVLGKQ